MLLLRSSRRYGTAATKCFYVQISPVCIRQVLLVCCGVLPLQRSNCFHLLRERSAGGWGQATGWQTNVEVLRYHRKNDPKPVRETPAWSQHQRGCRVAVTAVVTALLQQTDRNSMIPMHGHAYIRIWTYSCWISDRRSREVNNPWSKSDAFIVGYCQRL